MASTVKALIARFERRKSTTTTPSGSAGVEKEAARSKEDESYQKSADVDELQDTLAVLRVDNEGSSLANKELHYGVSLRHLASLPIPPFETVHAACAYVKSKTSGVDGYRSYAAWLLSSEETKHLVKPQANVFVSYAWNGLYQSTIQALVEHFNDSLDDTFVWMDFAIVDQHLSAERDINFDEWAGIFRQNLKQTGRAVLVLTPGHKPIAVSRSWCCFEWVSIVDSKIPFDFCVPKSDKQQLIDYMQRGMGFNNFNDIFAGINVEGARAFKPSDQEAILKQMREIGIIRVNDVVMLSLKSWLANINDEALKTTPPSTRQFMFVLNARGAMHSVLVRYPWYRNCVLR